MTDDLSDEELFAAVDAILETRSLALPAREPSPCWIDGVLGCSLGYNGIASGHD